VTTVPLPVFSHDVDRTDNAQLIVDLHTLDYLSDYTTILDVTYGQGGFWTRWRPAGLVTSDLDPNTNVDFRYDFQSLPFVDDEFDVVVFDPPYKLNGTSAHPLDSRYGVSGKYRSVTEKLKLILTGCDEAARVAARRVLVKCQDQVVSGQVVWQSHIVTAHMATLSWRLVDRLEVSGYRPQPEGVRQIHSRRTTSSLLVFEPWKGK
jgi:hypothetical protein